MTTVARLVVIGTREVIVVDLPTGSTVPDLEFETRARPIPFGCRSGSCGTCVVAVVDGHENLHPPDPDEDMFLEELGHQPGLHRLACQGHLRGDVTLRVPAP